MKKLSIESKIVVGFAAALLLLLLAGGQMYRSLIEYMDTSRLVAHTHLVLDAVEEMRFGVNALVNSQRTYIITGKKQYLEENRREEVKIRSVVARLSQLTADNPAQQQRSTELLQLLEERLKLLNSNIELYRAKGFSAARDRIYFGVADASMEALSSKFDAMKREEQSQLKVRSAKAERQATQALTVGAVLVLLTLTGLTLLWWRVRRSAQERQANEALLQESILMKQVSDNLMRDDIINKAYSDVLTLINQEWSSVGKLTEAALTKLDTHISIISGISYLVQGKSLVPLSAMGVPLPSAAGGMVQEALERNNIVSLHDIPAASLLCISTGMGSIAPREIIAVPLTAKNEVVAVLELASLNGFGETDLRIITRIVPQLGISINQKILEQVVMERSYQLEAANDELVTINDQSQTLNDALIVSNEKLQVQQKEIAESNLRLEAVSRSKSDFLANMSHELRTPLNSVIGFSEMLQDQLFGPINEKQNEYVDNILASGRHLLSLINDILDLSKVESGKMELDLSTFSLRESMDSSLMMLREKALKAEITLTMNLAPEADVTIVADQRKLKQIMFNLISNAVKFTQAGGAVEVKAVRDGDYLEISVTDSGMGIKAEDIPKLFQPFTQLESVYTKEYEGTGLGLALNRQLVELHGGRIWVESCFGKGSTFSFTMPLTQASVLPPRAPQPESVHTSGKTVLLIEDDPLTMASMENLLHSKGYRALRATNGKKGLEIIQHDRPDMIVLDLMMPGLSGFDVADCLQDRSEAVNVPILVLTSMDLSSADRTRLAGKVWRIEGKGSLSTHEFLNLVERAVAPQ